MAIGRLTVLALPKSECSTGNGHSARNADANTNPSWHSVTNANVNANGKVSAKALGVDTV